MIFGARGPFAAPAAAPPPAVAPAPARIRSYINGVPDTGQFLPDSTELARVNDVRITVRDFIWAYFNSYAEDRPSQDSLGRVTFLDNLVNKEVLGPTARQAGYAPNYEDRVMLREHTQRVLANALFHHAVLDSSDATEAQILHVYEQYKFEIHARHILFANTTTARKVRADLRNGRISWSEAVKKYSLSTSDRGPDGDVGWLVRATMPYALADALSSLKPGEITDVIVDEDGPQLVQCVGRRTVVPLGIESVRGTIRDQLRAYQAGIQTERLSLGLAKEIGFATDTAAVAWACTFFKPPVESKHDIAGTSVQLNAWFPEFSPADTSRVLGTWNGGHITVGGFLEAFSNIPPILRPDSSTPDALTQQVANVVLEPYRAQIANQRGYDKEPAVVAAIEAKREQLLVEHLYADSVESRVSVTADEARAYYKKKQSDFITYPSRRFAAIARMSQAGADSVVRELKAGTPAQFIIAADSMAGFRSGAFHDMREDEHGNMFRKVVYEELKPGQITTIGPNHNGEVAVVQLLSVTPGHQLSFAESREMIDNNLRAEKAEAEFQSLLKRLRKRFHITQHPELVMRIRLLDPAS